MTSRTKLGDFLADLYIEAHRRCHDPMDPVGFFDDNIEEGMATSARVAHRKLFLKRVKDYLDGEEASQDDEGEWYDHLERQHRSNDDNYVDRGYAESFFDCYDDESDLDWRD